MSGIYHVMLRGINKSDIFHDRMDFVKFRILLEQVVHPVDELGHPMPPRCRIFAYCMMSNHVHLLVKEESDNLSTLIKRIGGSYAQYYNVKYQRVGHLFQDRFRSEPVNTMEYFVTLLRYIHQNPVKAKIVPSPRDYLWSSFHEYSGTSTSLPRLCRTSSVTSRMNVGDLLKLIDEPLNDCRDILDVEPAEIISHTDNNLKEWLYSTYGIVNPLMIQSLEKNRRNYILKSIKEYRAGIRQLSRLTGVSYGVIQKL